MRTLLPTTLLAWLTTASIVNGEHEHLRRFPLQPMGAFKVQQAIIAELSTASNKPQHYDAQYFDQLTDHFSSSSTTSADFNTTFKQRYWIDTRYYRNGGPVILLDGGETSGEDRLEHMRTGIVRYLMEELGGIGIVLEHRYYGTSIVSQDLSKEGLKFLTTAQSLADNAYFAENLYKDLSSRYNQTTPDSTPWISYGGSYAGAKSAFLRVTYPEIFHGAIASSAVVWAGEEFWEYNEPVRLYGEEKCISVWREVVERIDVLSEYGGEGWLKFRTLFGIGDEDHVSDEDFANFVFSELGYWQARNWDDSLPEARVWEAYCERLTDGVEGSRGKQVLLQSTESVGVHNFAAQSRRYLDLCRSRGFTAKECIGTDDAAPYKEVGLEQTWRLWVYQVCIEWGYFITAAPKGHPSMLPRVITLDYTSKICQYAFDFDESHHPNTSIVLSYGSYNLTAPRLMYIDGAYDPWLYATVHSPYSPQQEIVDKGGKSVLVDEAWHHNDENGLGNVALEPERIRKVHEREIEVVRGWVEEFEKRKAA